MPGIDKNDISKFIPGQIADLALWIQADKSLCDFKPVQEYVKGISPSIATNILEQYGDNPSQSVLVAINSRVVSHPNSLIRLELDTSGRTRFPTFVSKPDALDVISLQDMVDPTNTGQRREKLCTKSEMIMKSANMTVFSISKNINIVFNDNLQILIIAVDDISAQDTEFSEILIYSRGLTFAEMEIIEGYFAYKRNDQYLLKLNHKYLPSIESIPFIKSISGQLSDTEIALRSHMENFDVAVNNYRAQLPDAHILQRAANLKEKANAAIQQLSIIRQNITKGALYSRKEKTETIESVFDSIHKLGLYSTPFTMEFFESKINDFKGVMNELDAYMKSLEDVDKDVAVAVDKNKTSDQMKRRTTAISVEALEDKNAAVEVKTFVAAQRAKLEAISKLGKEKYDALYATLMTKLKYDGENLEYYYTTIKSKWDALMVTYGNLDEKISSGDWLTYDAALDKTNTVTNRNNKVYHVKYVNSYLDRIQTLYEQIRNQIVEGDLVFLRNEAEYIISIFKTLTKKLEQRSISPLSKKMFAHFFKRKLKLLMKYEAEFKKHHSIMSDAVDELLRILGLNKTHSSSQIKLEKEFPIPITYFFKESAQNICYIRKVNKHDHSLTAIEYIVTNADGTIKYLDAVDREVEFIFPSLENISKSDVDDFYIKKLQFCSETGSPLFRKYAILKPYSKDEGVIDSISHSQVLSKFFHKVEGRFEIPRDSENGIYEMFATSPQPPILLPKYAIAVGTFFICVNVGTVAFHIQIPGYTEDSYDLIGPEEVCMYTYLSDSEASSKGTFYGRMQWMPNRIAYDTIFDRPRSSLCCKITELSKYICMITPTMPLFDRNGFLVEVNPDENANIYDIDDIHHAAPYKLTIGPDLKVSDLEINTDWGEKPGPAPLPTKLTLATESGTGLPVFCNAAGNPAVDEFGFTKYLSAHILQIKDQTVTRTSQGSSMEVVLDSTTMLIQYGLMWDYDLFKKVYRSNFVKSVNNTYIFVNSLGFPLVSPSNTYIEVDKYSFDPPYSVTYTENFITQYTYIPEESQFFVPNTKALEVKSYPMLIMRNSDERESATVLKAIQIISYRYTTGNAYIQYTVTKLQTELANCNALKARFRDIDETITLLNKCIGDIIKLHENYATYNDTITAIKTRELLSNKTNDEMMAMSTFDLKMKDVLGKVYKSFTDGMKSATFFKCILKRIDKIRAEIKDLREEKEIEIITSIINIQTVLKNQSLTQGTPPNPELTKLLNTCSKKKVEFDGVLNTLDDNINTIPTELSYLDKWVNDQDMLIERAIFLHHEILDIDSLHTVDVFTQQLSNNLKNTTKVLEENVEKVKSLIEYKKKIAKWLGLYPDAVAMKEYSEQVPIISSAQNLKGYTITFPIFEELQNPYIIRDWFSLLNTDTLSKTVRTRITIKITDPMKAFIDKYGKYYTKYDISGLSPAPSTYELYNADKLKEIVDASNRHVDGLIAEALDGEAELAPIFKEYKLISSDLRTEIQPVLVKQATDIQAKWVDSTGERTAMQTNLKLLEPYLQGDQVTRAAKIGTDMDALFTSDKLSDIDDIQHSLKVPDYYANMNYMKMIETAAVWNNTSSYLGFLSNEMSNIQESMKTLSSDITNVLSANIQTSRDDLQKEITATKAAITDGAKLKDFGDTIDPLLLKMMAKTPIDIPSTIEITGSITDIKRRLKDYAV